MKNIKEKMDLIKPEMDKDIKGQKDKCLCDNCGYVEGFVFYISELDCELCEFCCGYE